MEITDRKKEEMFLLVGLVGYISWIGCAEDSHFQGSQGFRGRIHGPFTIITPPRSNIIKDGSAGVQSTAEESR